MTSESNRIGVIPLVIIVALSIFIFAPNTANTKGTAIVRIVANPTSGIIGTKFVVNVSIENVVNLAGMQFYLSWDPSILQAVSITEVLFHSITPIAHWDNIWSLALRFNNTGGTAAYAQLWQDLIQAGADGYAPWNGSSTVATLVFNGVGYGTANLNFTNVVVGDMNAALIPITIISSSVTVTRKLQITARTFSLQNNSRTIFGQTSTVRIGANVTQGIHPISTVNVTIIDPVGKILVNNKTLTYVSGINQYNYRYDYKLNLTSCGTCTYTVYAKDVANTWTKASGTFKVMLVSTKSNGPWTVIRGNYYNATFTLYANGSQATSVKIIIDLPDWHSVAFVSINGTRTPFQSILSSRTGYTRYYAVVNVMNASAWAAVKFTIVTPMQATTGTKTIYYYCSWTTTEGYSLTETSHQQKVAVN